MIVNLSHHVKKQSIIHSWNPNYFHLTFKTYCQYHFSQNIHFQLITITPHFSIPIIPSFHRPRQLQYNKSPHFSYLVSLWLFFNYPNAIAQQLSKRSVGSHESCRKCLLPTLVDTFDTIWHLLIPSSCHYPSLRPLFITTLR